MNYESVFSLYLTWASCWANTLWVSLKSWGSQTQKYMYIIQRTFKNYGCPAHPGPTPRPVKSAFLGWGPRQQAIG